jgi:predicted DNA-binding antitoxin AbrB/MazE fold protein
MGGDPLEKRMQQIMNATVDNGLLKLDQPVTFPSGTRVSLVLQPLLPSVAESQSALAEMDVVCTENPINSGGIHLTRDQLHERH